MKFIFWIFNAKTIYALGWSIIHFIWQFSVLSLGLAAALAITRNQTSQLRYFLALSILLFAPVLFAINFLQGLQLWQELVINPDISSIQLTGLVNTILDHSLSYDKKEILFWSINDAIPILVFIWVLGVLFFSIRFIKSFLYIRNLKKDYFLGTHVCWVEKIKKWSVSLKIKKTVSLVESEKISSPITIGFLKPFIFFPVGMLSGLPAEQIEAIILHEMAHIARKDYMVNILQSVIETILFFHPAIWWISARVREERENCCDDLAISQMVQPVILANALVNVNMLTYEKSTGVLAFTGNDEPLTKRVKRLVGLTFSREKTSLTSSGSIIIFLAAVILFSFSCSINKSSEPESVRADYYKYMNNIRFIYVDDDSQEVAVFAKFDTLGEVVKLVVGEKVIAGEKLGEYSSLIQRAKDKVKSPETIALSEKAKDELNSAIQRRQQNSGKTKQLDFKDNLPQDPVFRKELSEMVLKVQLIVRDVIVDNEEYNLKLTTSGFWINEKKQADSVFVIAKNVYKQFNNKEVTDKWEFTVH